MAPTAALSARLTETEIADTRGRASLTYEGTIVEAWAQGYQVGSLVILILLVICNYRRHVLLHKLIVLELILALWHGTFIFFPDPIYGWYLSSTATLLFMSYNLHNVIAFLKIRVFLPRWGRLLFVVSLAIVTPYWVVEAWDNFMYFNEGSIINTYTRPWEALFRDPWWIFTLVWLLYQITSRYQFTFLGLLRTSPRFGIMIFCMILSIIFMLVDVVVTARGVFTDTGINPYWRLTLVFKCAADTIFLDDFKSVLDKIVDRRFKNIYRSSGNNSQGLPTVIRSDVGAESRRNTSVSSKRRPSWFTLPRKASRDDGSSLSPRAGGFHFAENGLPNNHGGEGGRKASVSSRRGPSCFSVSHKTRYDETGGFHFAESALASIPGSATTEQYPHQIFHEGIFDKGASAEAASDGSRRHLNDIPPLSEETANRYLGAKR